MKEKKPGRPIHLSAKPAKQKAELQAGEIWGQQAGALLKQVMDNRGWGFRELTERLTTLGIEMTPPTVNRRINRGNFSAGFLLMCLEAMGARFDVAMESAVGCPQSLPNGPKKTMRLKKPVDGLEAIVGSWGSNRASD